MTYRSFTVIAILSLLALGVSVAHAGDAPPPGKWSFSHDKLISGENTPFYLRYMNGEKPLPPGAYYRFLIEPVSVQTLLFCPPSVGLELVAWHGELPNVKLSPSPVDGVGFRQVRLAFPDGLEAGASFALAIGNRNDEGKIVALVNPVPVENLTFEMYSGQEGELFEKPASDPAEAPQTLDPWALGGDSKKKERSWLQEGWTANLPKLDIKAAAATTIRLFAPTLIQTGEEFELRISVVDPFDSRAFPNYIGEITLTSEPNVMGLPEKVAFYQADNSVKAIGKISIKSPGVYRISARLGDGKVVVESNPIVVRKKVDTPIYWGTMHNHGAYSEGWGDSLDVTYEFARDVSGYDYFAMADHRGSVPTAGENQGRLLSWRLGHQVDSLESWKENIAKANEYHDPGRFVTLIGYEYSSGDISHHNIYVTEVKDNDDIFPAAYRNSAFEVYDKVQAADALFFPHSHADIMPFTRLEFRTTASGHPLTPVYEVYSDWGATFEPYGVWSMDSLYGGLRTPLGHSFLWALENGYKLGVISDTDTHTGLPGRRMTSGLAPWHRHPHGITAARMDKFDRDGLMEAYRTRRTYGTTGERIFLEVLANDVPMGQEFTTDDPFSIRVSVAGTAPIQRVTLYQGLTVVDERKLNGEREGTFVFEGLIPEEREKGYAVVAYQDDENRAWSSPIWVRRTSVPDLAWRRNSSGGLELVNYGAGIAENVVIVHSDSESPFTAEGIRGYEPGWDERAGYLWTVVKDNNRVAVYYRWRGQPITGSVQLKGAKDYTIDFAREWLLSDAEFNDDHKGHCTFKTGKPFTKVNAIGMDFLIDLDEAMPSSITLEFDESVTTYIGENKQEGRVITIPLDGRTSAGPLRIAATVTLEPGQHWSAPTTSGVWAADPGNDIIETDESNNQY
jgi:uncharacterized protein DUF3604